jgi:hypothetical protein
MKNGEMHLDGIQKRKENVLKEIKTADIEQNI